MIDYFDVNEWVDQLELEEQRNKYSQTLACPFTACMNKQLERNKHDD